MNTTELFEKVGAKIDGEKDAREKTAVLCGVDKFTTYKWDLNGVPSKHWQTLSKTLGVALEEIAAVAPASETKAKAS